MTLLSSPTHFFLVGVASTVDSAGLNSQCALERVFVRGRWYHVLRGAENVVTQAVTTLRQQSYSISCLMDRVYLISDIDGISTAAHAFFDVIATDYETMISSARNASCAEHLYAVARELQPFIDRGTVLDFGCGTGISSAALARACDRVVGFDSSESMRTLARAAGVDVKDTMTEIGDGSIASVVACYVFHFGVRQSDVSELSRVVCQGGTITANFHKGMGAEEAANLFPRVGFDVCKIDRHGSHDFGTVIAFRRGEP